MAQRVRYLTADDDGTGGQRKQQKQTNQGETARHVLRIAFTVNG
jgi:hypothetical protein